MVKRKVAFVSVGNLSIFVIFCGPELSNLFPLGNGATVLDVVPALAFRGE
jgi:hypothetical protein